MIHKHPPPCLHGILKQRTVSESSEDFYLEDVSSPRSGDEVDPLSSSSSSYSKRRSVSFNSYVDRASFKSAASPSSMTTALKSKRRRQRKREARVNGRTRSTSEGTSEGSSCEYFSHSDVSHSEGEHESESEGVDSKQTKSPAVNIPESNSPGKKKNKKKNRKSRKEATVQIQDTNHAEQVDSDKISSPDSEEGPAGENGLDFRTKSTSCVMESVKEIQESPNVEEQSGVKGDQVTNGKISQTDKNKKIISEIKNKLSAGTEIGGGDVTVEKVDSDDECDTEAVSDNRTGGGDDVCDVKNDCDNLTEPDQSTQKSKSEVETMLSWEDPVQNGGEHVTNCAVQLQNSIMFDLDVD